MAQNEEEMNSDSFATTLAPEQMEKKSTQRLSEKLTKQEFDLTISLTEKLLKDSSFKPDHISLEANIVNAYRFLKARNFVVKDAEELWRNAVKWRINYRLTERRERLKRKFTDGPGVDPVHDFVSKNMLWYLTGEDKNGVPGLVLRAGTCDPAGLVREVGDIDLVIERFLDLLERVFEIAIEKDVLDLGIVELTDLRDGGVPGWYSRAYNAISIFRPLAKIMDEVYVERVRVLLLVGAPGLFSTIWMMVQPMVPSQTRKKIFIFGGNDQAKWLDGLTNHISIENIPAILGGKGSDENVVKGGKIEKGSFQEFKKSYPKV